MSYAEFKDFCSFVLFVNYLKEKGLTNQHFIFTTEEKSQIEKLLLDWREKKEPAFPVRRIK